MNERKVALKRIKMSNVHSFERVATAESQAIVAMDPTDIYGILLRLTVFRKAHFAMFAVKILTAFLTLKEKGLARCSRKSLISNGAPGRIRTLGRRLRRPMLYPTELLARWVFLIIEVMELGQGYLHTNRGCFIQIEGRGPNLIDLLCSEGGICSGLNGDYGVWNWSGLPAYIL